MKGQKNEGNSILITVGSLARLIQTEIFRRLNSLSRRKRLLAGFLLSYLILFGWFLRHVHQNA